MYQHIVQVFNGLYSKFFKLPLINTLRYTIINSTLLRRYPLGFGLRYLHLFSDLKAAPPVLKTPVEATFQMGPGQHTHLRRSLGQDGCKHWLFKYFMYQKKLYIYIYVYTNIFTLLHIFHVCSSIFITWAGWNHTSDHTIWWKYNLKMNGLLTMALPYVFWSSHSTPEKTPSWCLFGISMSCEL